MKASRSNNLESINFRTFEEKEHVRRKRFFTEIGLHLSRNNGITSRQMNIFWERLYTSFPFSFCNNHRGVDPRRGIDIFAPGPSILAEFIPRYIYFSRIKRNNGKTSRPCHAMPAVSYRVIRTALRIRRFSLRESDVSSGEENDR